MAFERKSVGSSRIHSPKTMQAFSSPATARCFLASAVLAVLPFTASAQAPVAAVAGSYVSVRDVVLELADKRPPPAERSQKIHTPQGDKDRLDDNIFEQSPLAAFSHALSDQVSAEFLDNNRTAIELAELNVAVGERRGRRVPDLLPNASQASAPIAPLANAIAWGLLQMFEDSKGSRPIFLDVVLRFEGRTVTCEGLGLFPADYAAGGWQRALQQAANLCARRLENLPPPPDITEGPRRVR